MSDFEKKEGNLGYSITIGGIVFFVVTGLAWWAIWKVGFGPWPWTDLHSEKMALNANFLYAVHFLFPGYVGSLGRNWAEFQDVLVRKGAVDSFLIQVYFPIFIGILFGAIASLLTHKSDTKKPTAQTGYVRGSKIK
jgi:hypothetical protein